MFQLHKNFVSVLELKDHPQLAQGRNIQLYKIGETVLEKFKLAIISTKSFHKMLLDFYEYKNSDFQMIKVFIA